MSKPPQFFLHHYGGASSEVWHAEVDYLNVHFAGEWEKWESMVHYDESLAFWLYFVKDPKKSGLLLGYLGLRTLHRNTPPHLHML